MRRYRLASRTGTSPFKYRQRICVRKPRLFGRTRLAFWGLPFILLLDAGSAFVEAADTNAPGIPLVMPGTKFVAVATGPADRKAFNDFCVFRDDHQLWHLFAISTHRSGDPAFPHPSLLHATSRAFTGPWEHQPYLDLGPAHNWAPYIVRDPLNPLICLMFLGGSEAETLRSYESDTRDLFRWKLRKDLGKAHGTRDPMVRFDEGRQCYFLYATMASAGHGNEGIAVSVSTNLNEWKTVHVIPTGSKNTCDESPFVVKRGGWYYLWATISSIHYYRGVPTRVFRSADPEFCDLPNTRAEHALCQFPMHAIEIVEDGEQMWIGQTGHGGPGIVFSRLQWGTGADSKSEQQKKQ